MCYLTIFAVSLLSGSLLPMGSEALFIYDLKNNCSPLIILLSATLGNSLGAVVNYYFGLKGEGFLQKRGYLSREKMEKAKLRFKRYGHYALLLSPLPIIGDPITFVAGVAKYNFKKFLLIVTFAKLIRYSVLVVIFNY